MKIVDRTRNETKNFKNLKLEDVFRWDGRLFMKVSNCHEMDVSMLMISAKEG